ncbi:MAG: hypothetical protein AB7I18_10160 [Candidatus Berkiella sp.]
MSKRIVLLIVATPIFVLLNYHIAFFAHEYAHSLMAWLLNIKSNPFDIHYGGTSWKNLIFLLNLHENIQYAHLFSQGRNDSIALIAISGIGLGNGLFYLLSIYLLQNKTVKDHPLLYYFIFWLNFMSLAHFYHYVPLLVFSPIGDMANLSKALAISPWIIYILFSYLVIFMLYHFYTKTLITTYQVLNSTKVSQAALLILCTILMFGYVALDGILGGQGVIPLFLSITSIAAIPGILAACWPTRKWINQYV